MTHPWAQIREDRCLTQLEVAGHLKVTRQTVIRLEQGLFHAPSSEVLKELEDLYGVNDLLESYSEYVKNTREDFREQYSDFSRLKTYLAPAHPLESWRLDQRLSRMGLCKGLCLDYGPVADYEYNKQRATPESLSVACKEIGWDLAPLEEAVKRWRIKWR